MSWRMISLLMMFVSLVAGVFHSYMIDCNPGPAIYPAAGAVFLMIFLHLTFEKWDAPKQKDDDNDQVA